VIYIEPYLGTEARIFDCLLKISGCDPGLSAPVFTATKQMVVFNPKGPSSFSSGRLLEIVMSVKPVFIYGVDDSYITPWGVPIGEFGAATAVDLTASSDSSSIFIDVTEAGGQGYRSLNVNGKFIYAPLAVILFHELAHAYHGMIVDDTPGDELDDQLLAIHDENQFRSHLGLPTRNPNITSHGIIGSAEVGPTTLKMCNEAALFPDLCKCNIATAALGSPVARQIVEFRRAKRELEKLTLGGAPILAPMWNAYQMFSPAVAGRILTDPELRVTMLRYGLQPAVYLLRAMRTYLDAEPHAAEGADVVDQNLDGYLAEVSGVSHHDLLDAADAAEQASLALRRHDTVDAPPPNRTPGDLFTEVAFNIQTRNADSRGPAWVLEGLAAFLLAAAARLDRAEQCDPTVAFSHWLTQVPLPAPSADISTPELTDELVEIGRRVLRREELRRDFARRLLAEFPQSRAALRAAIGAADFPVDDESDAALVEVS
jgi:hypothetical protein